MHFEGDSGGNSFQLSQISVTIDRSVIWHENTVRRVSRHGVGLVFTDGAPLYMELDFGFRIWNLLFNIGGLTNGGPTAMSTDPIYGRFDFGQAG